MIALLEPRCIGHTTKTMCIYTEIFIPFFGVVIVHFFSQCSLFFSKKKLIYEWIPLCKYSDFIWFLAPNYQLESNHNFQHLFLPRPFKNCIHYWYLDTILKYVVCTLLKPCTKLKYTVSHFVIRVSFCIFPASGTWHMYRYSSNVSIVSIQGDFIDFF